MRRPFHDLDRRRYGQFEAGPVERLLTILMLCAVCFIVGYMVGGA